jgi:hypothetical protein
MGRCCHKTFLGTKRKNPPGFHGDSSNVDVALTRFAITHTQAKRSTFNSLVLLNILVAGTGFEPVTFRL